MTIELIAAAAANGTIGIGNRLPWRVPEDFAFFRRTTTGHPVVMGRKTYESFGAKPLPKRLNVVITRQRGYDGNGALVAGSLAEALRVCGAAERVFIIGGAEIYRQAMPFADVVWLTRMDCDFVGDAVFPTIPREIFWGARFRTLPATDARPFRVDFYRWTRRPDAPALKRPGR